MDSLNDSSTTIPGNNTNEDSDFRWESIIFLIPGVYILFVNGFVIAVISFNPALHTHVHMHMVSLSVTDLLIGVLCFMTGVYFLTDIGKYFDNSVILCLTLFSVGYSIVFCSVFNTCLIALDRFVYVFYPFQYIMFATNENALFALVCAWLAAIILGSVPVSFQIYYEGEECTTVNVLSHNFHKYVCSLVFFIGCSSKAIVYGRIGCISYKTIKAIEDSLIVRHETTCTNLNRRNTTGIRAFIRSIKLFGAIFGCFFLCWFPYIYIVLAVHNPPKLLVHCSLALGYSYSGINGFLYGYFDTNFRRTAEMILCPPRFCAWFYVKEHAIKTLDVDLESSSSAVSVETLETTAYDDPVDPEIFNDAPVDQEKKQELIDQEITYDDSVDPKYHIHIEVEGKIVGIVPV